jgi:eukaryotic-like serine/threonine-protein kinase
MPMRNPTSKDVFRRALLRSGLVTQDQLKAAWEAAGGDAAGDEALSVVLVRRGLITEYQSTQLRAGRSKLNLGPYLITDFIGQGGMGQVFKGVHRVMGRVCAVKVLPLEKATDEARMSFMREIRLQAGLDCPYLVRAFDAGQDGNVHYLVTEYVPGQDLRKLIKMHHRLDQQQAASVIMQAARGLEYAHGQGLIHRDLKPGNLLVTPEGSVKVSDLGLAAWSTSILEDPRAGKIVGTADYLSPEQIRTPLEITPASDIYSLGCTLYFCVCGKAPFAGGDSASKCRRHCEETAWHPRKFAPEISEDFVDIIADMMEKDPSRRIGTAAEVAERLEPFCQQAPAWVPQTLARGPWSEPPPPAEEMPAIMPQEEVPQTQLTAGGSAVSSAGATSLAKPPPISDVPPPPPTYMATLPAAPQDPALMSVAIALAIAIPLALLVGALIGFFVRGAVDN